MEPSTSRDSTTKGAPTRTTVKHVKTSERSSGSSNGQQQQQPLEQTRSGSALAVAGGADAACSSGWATPSPSAGHIPHRHTHRHIHRHGEPRRGGAGEVWDAARGVRAHLGVQGTADADRRRRFSGLATEGALWPPRHSYRSRTRSSAASRRCSSSSSSSGSNLSAVSVSAPASSTVSVITVIIPTNQLDTYTTR